MGEGGGALVLESEQSAAARGATVLGRLRGYGATNDAFHITAPEPSGAGAANAIAAALGDAGLGAEDIGYVNAHGTSTTRTMDSDGPPVAISNSFGFGGHNAVVCLDAA